MTTPAHRELVERFDAARRDPAWVVLEGFHSLKHAIRFGAEVEEIVAVDRDRVRQLAESMAPDVLEPVVEGSTQIPRDIFERLSYVPPPTGIIAIARRPDPDVAEVVSAPGPSPIILLDHPARLGNLGAAIRVAAAAGVAGVMAMGEHDPYHPEAVRGGAGLQFALPVVRIDALPDTDRPLVAIDPTGENLVLGGIPPRALLAFGSERTGLGKSILDRSALRRRIPMRAGVSSLNLATAVAVVLYAWRFGTTSSGR